MGMSPYLDIILRCIGVYLFMVVAIRVFGKKELSQLSTTDLVFLVLISNSVQNAMVGPNVSLAGGIIAASVLFSLNYMLKILMYRSDKVKELIEGKPVILVSDGKIDITNLHNENISLDELEEAIREHGIESYKEVRLAILEVDGNISVISEESNTLRQSRYKHRKKQKNLINN
ncbi:MAG: YetF domain-containing protein [Pedobacter sp.]